MRQRPLLVIFLTVFLDLVGFGIVFPLLPRYVANFGAPAWAIGLIVASYSLMQFVFAPRWGRLSDRLGRRPVLLVSTAGFAVSHALFALGSSAAHAGAALGLILAARLLGGLCGANLTVAQACIADLSPPDQRTKRMGLIGLAFGLGFIGGPLLAVVALLKFGLAGPGWVAAALSAANLALMAWLLPETRAAAGPAAAPRPRPAPWRAVLARPRIGVLVLLFFLATFAFTCFETTLGLLVARNFHFAPEGADAEIATAFLFAFCGLTGAFVQGGPLGRLVKRLGEPRLIALSLGLVAVSLVPLPFLGGAIHHSPSQLVNDHGVPWWRTLGLLFTLGGAPWALLLLALAVLAVGSGLTRPPLFGMISRLTPADEQGATLGVAQSAGSLARIAGPVFASAAYGWAPAVPYLACAAISLAAGVLAWVTLAGNAGPVSQP
jgi:MFS family permease